MWTSWIFVAETVVIVTGNVTLLIVFTRTPALRKRKHYLLINLAVADFLVGVISVPMYGTMPLISYTRTANIMYQVQDILFGTASVFGLAAVAIERAYAVYFPFKHRTLWKGVYMIGMAGIWMMALLFATSEIYADNFVNVIIIAVILISLFTVIFSYTVIWIRMNCMSPISSNAIPRRDRKLTVTLLIVTVISLLFPFLVLNVMSFFDPQSLGSLGNIVMATKFCHYGNSLINPIVYALCMPDFKRALRMQIVCCDSIRKQAAFLHESREGNKVSDGTYQEHRLENYHGNYNEDHDKTSKHHGDNNAHRDKTSNRHGDNNAHWIRLPAITMETTMQTVIRPTIAIETTVNTVKRPAIAMETTVNTVKRPAITMETTMNTCEKTASNHHGVNTNISSTRMDEMRTLTTLAVDNEGFVNETNQDIKL
ncbi:adenosine receptor A3-like [Actinia tenebrosa]|uniref:Adenosine receptor A3-like n=1 Tax=Actinia tenebrosa TaxID=6105 RepID=A0A6P8HX74_ACTTE|nr:adenosine receptor A3-like [Actinia tenebrosa]